MGNPAYVPKSPPPEIKPKAGGFTRISYLFAEALWVRSKIGVRGPVELGHKSAKYVHNCEYGIASAPTVIPGARGVGMKRLNTFPFRNRFSVRTLRELINLCVAVAIVSVPTIGYGVRLAHAQFQQCKPGMPCYNPQPGLGKGSGKGVGPSFFGLSDGFRAFSPPNNNQNQQQNGGCQNGQCPQSGGCPGGQCGSGGFGGGLGGGGCSGGSCSGGGGGLGGLGGGGGLGGLGGGGLGGLGGGGGGLGGLGGGLGGMLGGMLGNMGQLLPILMMMLLMNQNKTPTPAPGALLTPTPQPTAIPRMTVAPLATSSYSF